MLAHTLKKVPLFGILLESSGLRGCLIWSCSFHSVPLKVPQIQHSIELVRKLPLGFLLQNGLHGGYHVRQTCFRLSSSLLRIPSYSFTGTKVVLRPAPKHPKEIALHCLDVVRKTDSFLVLPMWSLKGHPAYKSAIARWIRQLIVRAHTTKGIFFPDWWGFSGNSIIWHLLLSCLRLPHGL